MLVAVDEIADGAVVEPNPGPRVVHPSRQALGETVLALRLEYVGGAQNPPGELRARWVAGAGEVVPQVKQGSREIEAKLADPDVVHGVLVGQVEVPQDLGSIAGADRVGPERVVRQETRDGLEDDIVLGVARG